MDMNDARPGILVVEDEARIRALLKVALHDFVLWMAANGDEAIELYQTHQPQIQLVLLDVRMPGLTGPETVRRLQRINPAVRFCFMSGDTGDYTEQALRDMGAVCFIRKPFEVQALTALLEDLLGEDENDTALQEEQEHP